jgi:hypothetical protein
MSLPKRPSALHLSGSADASDDYYDALERHLSAVAARAVRALKAIAYVVEKEEYCYENTTAERALLEIEASGYKDQS